MTISDDAVAATPAASGGTKASLLVVFLTVFIDLLGFGIVLPLLPIYSVEFSAQYQLKDWQTNLITGLLMASFSAMQFIFMPIWGRLSDRVGRRPVLILGLCGSTLFYAVFGIATVWRSLAGLFVARIGAGIAGATISTAQAYIADVTTKENRAKGMALIGAAFAGGFLLGPMFGIVSLRPDRSSSDKPQPTATADAQAHAPASAAVDATAVADAVEKQTSFSPWPGFLASGLSGVALLIALFKLVESWRPGAEHAERPLFDRSALHDALATPSVGLLLATSFIAIYSFACFESTLALQIKRMVEDQVRSTAAANSDSSSTSAEAESTLLTSLVRRVQGWGYRGKMIGMVVVYSIFGYLGIVLTLAQGFLVRRLSGRLSEATMAVVGGVTASLGFLTLAWGTSTGSFEMFIVGMTIEVTGFAFVNPSLQSLISRRSDPAKQGGILGLGQSASSLARIFGPATGPVLILPAFPALPYFVALGLLTLGTGMVIQAARSGKDFPH